MTWLSRVKKHHQHRFARAYSRIVLLRLLKRGGLITGILGLMTLMFLLFSFSGVAAFSRVELGSNALSINTFSGLPIPIVDDAAHRGIELYGRSKEADIYTRQLLAIYKEAKDKDFIILFTPGGWGVSRLEDSPDWKTILSGIESSLHNSGYSVISFNYQRTSNSFAGKLNELKEIITGYMSKARELATGIEFLTRHNSNVRIILGGDSTGTMLCDSTMNLLKNNPRVYSIQTGMPFWQKNTINGRTLALNDNGLAPDAFSNGDIMAILTASIKSFVGIEQPEGSGTIAKLLVSPGHEYFWDAPGISSRIENFLMENFHVKPTFSY